MIVIIDEFVTEAALSVFNTTKDYRAKNIAGTFAYADEMSNLYESAIHNASESYLIPVSSIEERMLEIAVRSLVHEVF